MIVDDAIRTGGWKELVAERLAWRPLGLAHARPVPWLARALLLENNLAQSVAPLLCASLVCMPLAQAVMSRCLDLEAVIRSRFAGRSDVAPPDAREDFRSFCTGLHSDVKFYPAASPMRAFASVWTYVTLGGFIRGLRMQLRDRGHRLASSLCNLRNSVMHGHYVSYRTLTLLREIEEQLSEELERAGEPEVYRMVRT